MKFSHLVLFLIALLPQYINRDFTPDNELRYLSIVNENLELGRYFAFLHHGAIYSDKPPLFIWLLMLSKKMLGSHIMLALAAYSIIPALVILQTLDRWTKTVLPATWRLTAGLVLFTSIFFLGSAAVIRMDMMMSMFIVLAAHTFYQMYTHTLSLHKGQWYIGIYVFLAVFVKGPVGLIIPLLTSITFLLIKGQFSSFWRYWSWRTFAVLLGCCAIWFAMVWKEGGASYLNSLLVHQTVDRAVDAFHHKKPFYFYGVSIWYVVAPWSLLLFAIAVNAVRHRIRLSDLELYFALLFGLTLLFFSIISSKIAVYLLPGIPFLVYLCFLLQDRLPESTFIRFAVALPAIIFVLATPTLLIGSSFYSLIDISTLVVLASIFLTVAGLLALYFLISMKPFLHAVMILGAGLLAAVFTAGLVVGQYNDRLGYRALAEAGSCLAAKSDKACFVSLDINRPENMDVFIGKSPLEIDRKTLISGRYNGCVLFVDTKKIAQDAELIDFLQVFHAIEVGGKSAYILQVKR